MKKRDERLDLLIAEGLMLVQGIEKAKLRLDTIHAELDAYFAGEGALEHIATEFGTAMRIVDERIIIDPPCVPDVMVGLGKDFPRIFETKTQCTARAAARVMLVNADSPLAQRLQEFLIISRTRHFVFTPGKAKAVIDIP